MLAKPSEIFQHKTAIGSLKHYQVTERFFSLSLEMNSQLS